MQNADTLLNIYRKRGADGLPLERVYRHLFNPDHYLKGYGRIYRNFGAMTKGSTEETVDGMSVRKIHAIIDLLKQERYQWSPVRRVEIPKPNGKKRPLGIPTWGDKLVQEVLRALLEPYYEGKFSDRSHGFRPDRGCHTALNEVRKTWTGTVWFIEGDIKGAFDNVDHSTLLDILRRDIKDGRTVQLIENLLKAGYMEDWRYHDSSSGTPQGGIISPLLFNIYLNDLDRFVEDTLVAEYTEGSVRRNNPAYTKIGRLIKKARERGDIAEANRLLKDRRGLTAGDPVDGGYRRLRYIRYADDFLMGFIGPKNEAAVIRDRIGEFLGQKLRLTLSEEKTLITHAVDEKAKFLGYEITVTREGDLLAANGTRAANGRIALLMPQTVVHRYNNRYSKGGRIVHRVELLADNDLTIIQRYQNVLQGVYNYFCMAINVSRRMNYLRWLLEMSMTKTLARKHQCSVTNIYRKYRGEVLGLKVIQAAQQRPGKTPLTATFGGFPMVRVPGGIGTAEFGFEAAWFPPGNKRSEVVQRLLAGKCELCGVTGEPLEVHHIRKLEDLDRPGRRPKEGWEKIMSARKRKTLVACGKCHDNIHAGRYDGPRL